MAATSRAKVHVQFDASQQKIPYKALHASRAMVSPSTIPSQVHIKIDAVSQDALNGTSEGHVFLAHEGRVITKRSGKCDDVSKDYLMPRNTHSGVLTDDYDATIHDPFDQTRPSKRQALLSRNICKIGSKQRAQPVYARYNSALSRRHHGRGRLCSALGPECHAGSLNICNELTPNGDSDSSFPLQYAPVDANGRAKVSKQSLISIQTNDRPVLHFTMGNVTDPHRPSMGMDSVPHPQYAMHRPSISGQMSGHVAGTQEIRPSACSTTFEHDVIMGAGQGDIRCRNNLPYGEDLQDPQHRSFTISSHNYSRRMLDKAEKNQTEHHSMEFQGCPILRAEDASRADRVLSWATEVYAALISAFRDAQKQKLTSTCPNPQQAFKSNMGSVIHNAQLQLSSMGGYPQHAVTYDSPANQSIQGANGVTHEHPLDIVNAKIRGCDGGDLRPVHGNIPFRSTSIQASLQHQPFMKQAVTTSSINPAAIPESRAPNYQTFPPVPSHVTSAITPQCYGVDLVNTARQAISILGRFCHVSNAPWFEGMLHIACLAYALGDYQESVYWFSRILDTDQNHVEAMSKLAVVLMAMQRRQEAESYWRMAIKLQPSFLEAAEHLVELLCSEHRRQEALEVANSVLTHLPSSFEHYPENSQKPRHGAEKTNSEFKLPQGSKSFAENLNLRTILPARVDVRSLALMHLKGNILYSMNDHAAAARAFEEVVLIAVRVHKTLLGVVDSVLDVFSRPYERRDKSEPLLLTPKKALETVKLCFPNGEHLNGIHMSSNWTSRLPAVSILSNSLLSLAKVFQDSVACNPSTLSSSSTKYEVRHILALYYLSFSLKPSPSTANNIGILMANVQRNMPDNHCNYALEDGEALVPGVVPGSGIWLALKYYEYGLTLDPKHAHLYTNLGSLLKDLGHLPLAIEMYQRAVRCDAKFDIALANLANAVKDQGKTKEAIFYYRKAVEVNPNFAEARCGLANVLSSICDWTARGGMVVNNGVFDKWHVDENGALVDSQKSGRRSFGWIRHVVDVVDSQSADVDAWGRAMFDRQSLEIFANQLLSHQLGEETYEKQGKLLRETLSYWSGENQMGSRVVRLVERAMRSISWKWYHDKYSRFRESHPSTYTRPQIPPSLPTLGAPKVLPFHTFTLPLTARQIRSISQRNGLRTTCMTLRSPWLPTTVYPPPPPPAPQLNVGYVSSDFNNHPLAHLMQSVFGLHDSNRVKAICYATTASDSSSHRHKIETEATRFYDASGWSTEQLVRQIVGDNIHILINLNGYTRGARNEVFAARPAPIQMSFMGYAGSLGAEWCDYILADETAVPVETLRPWRSNVSFEDLMHDENSGTNNHDWVYGENIIYTRGSFFCCDHRQSASLPGEIEMTWEEEQRRRWKMRKEIFPTLKDDAIIFGNFNQLYKIEPTIFRTWLRILSRVPMAILWLLRFPDLGEAQLRASAQAWAGPAVAARIVFSDVAPKDVHIARACVIDLFLDTPECNGHTTAADCLWSGTPLLTLPRYAWKMASRMAAGILGGAFDRDTREGREAWAELVVGSEDEYEDTAVRLAWGLRYHEGCEGVAEGRLMGLRKLLWRARWRRGGLFDTERWVRVMEDAYDEAWRRWVRGEGGDIRLADL